MCFRRVPRLVSMALMPFSPLMVMNWLRGDVAGILHAQALGAKAVVTTMSFNNAQELSGAFANVCCTRIGSPYVIAGVEALIAVGELLVVGFEPNGDFLVGTPLASTDGVYSP